MTAPGLTLTTQVPADAVAALTLADTPVTELSAEFTRSTGVQNTILESIRDAAAGLTTSEFLDVLEDTSVDAVDRDLAALAVRVARGDKRAALDLLRAIQTLGQGHSTTEDVHVLPRLLSLGGETPTLVLRLQPAFFDGTLSRDQRLSVCEWTAALAKAVDVRLVATGLQQRRLYQAHRDDLPVSHDEITPPTRGPLADVVDAALDEFNHDSREVNILRRLQDEDAETLPYTALYSAYSVGRTTISLCISALEKAGLVATFQSTTQGKSLELLPPGREFLETLNAEIGRQQRLDEAVSDVFNPSDDSRVPRTGGSPPAPDVPDRRRLPAWHQVEPYARWNAAAASAASPENGIGVVDRPVPKAEDRGAPRWNYDADRDRLVVGAEYDNPLQYWVCVARALTSGLTFSEVLPPSRLDEDAEDFAALLADHKDVLRDSRCLGYLPDDVEDGVDLRDQLLEAEAHLCTLTKELDLGDNDDRGTITSEALGLAGTMVHLLDLVGVDVHREVRLPEFSRNAKRPEDVPEEKDSTIEGLAKTIAKGASIQSRYGHFSAYRQLYESRSAKQPRYGPDVDAADPYGELIGSFTLVGDLGSKRDRLVEEIEAELADPGELRDDAPEFAIPISIVEDADRRMFAEVVAEMAAAKNLRPTREAVSVLRLLLETPYDAAEALHGLRPEDDHRDLRLDELRYALCTLPSDRLLSWEASSAGAVLQALLASTTPQTVTEIAEKADVSRTTVYNHRGVLEALGVLQETDAGLRLALPFRTTEERGAPITPDVLDADNLTGVAERLADAVLPVGEYIRATHSLGFVDGPPDYGPLLDAAPQLEDWLRVLEDVVPGTLAVDGESGVESPALLGPEPAQASLQEVTG